MFKQFLICVEIEGKRYGYKYESNPNPSRRKLAPIYPTRDVWESDCGIALGTARGKLAKVIIRPLSIGSPVPVSRPMSRELSAEDRDQIIHIIETRRIELLDKEDMWLCEVTDSMRQEHYATLSCFGVIYRTAVENLAVIFEIIKEVENDLSFESEYMANATILGKVMGAVHMTVIDPVEYFRSIYF